MCIRDSSSFQMGCFVVAKFLLTSASRGPSAIAEPLVISRLPIDVHDDDGQRRRRQRQRQRVTGDRYGPMEWAQLRYSNPFQNANVRNEKRSSNCGRVVAQFSISAIVKFEVTCLIFTKFVHGVEALLSPLMYARAIWNCISFRSARARSEGGQFRRLQKVMKIN